MTENSKINLDSLITNPFEVNAKNIDIISLQMYNGLQCQCARSIHLLLDSIRKFLESYSLEPQQYYLDTEVEIPFIIDVYNNINLTITIMFKISDLFPILKLSEPFFFKSLLMMHLYFDKLLIQRQVKRENTSIPGADENREYKTQKNENGSRIKTSVDTEHVTNITDHNMNKDDIVFLTNLTLIQNMILQMINLIEGFTIQTCNKSKEHINIDILFSEHLKNLINLENYTNTHYRSILFTTFNMNEVLLTNFFSPDSEHLINILRPCVRYMTEASIIIISNNSEPHILLLRDMFDRSKQTYKIEVIYEYLKSVYDVQLKIVYHKINELIDNIEMKTLQNQDSKVYMDLYIESLKKLQSSNLPIDFIRDINILLKFDKPNIVNAKKIVEHKLKFLSHVQLPEGSEFTSTTLDEIIEPIGNHEFKQFLWVFNLLHYEVGKKSDYVYEVSLKFASHLVNLTTNINLQNKSNFKCESLKNIYINFFRYETLIQQKRNLFNNLTNSDDIKQLLLNISRLHIHLANHLYQVMKLWADQEYLHYGDDLLKILMAIIIHLRNINNTEFDTSCISNESYSFMSVEEIVDNKIDKIIRIGYLTMNLLDNYQMCNCKYVNNQVINYEHYSRVNVLSKYGLNDSIMFITNVPMPNKNIKISDDIEIKLTLNEQEQSLEDNNTMEITQPTTAVPFNYYDLSYLAKTNFFKNDITLLLFPNLIKFNWYGHIIPFSSLDMSKYMINIYQLVDYQRLILKWKVSLFYTVWIVFFEHSCAITTTDYDEMSTSAELNTTSSSTMFHYLDTFLSMEFQELFTTYAIDTIFEIYNKDLVKTLNTFKILKIIMIEQMKSFRMVDVDRAMNDIKNLIKNGKITKEVNFEKILNQFILDFKMYINTLKKHLIYLK